MASPLATLKPTTIWSHFDQIRQIPRPSKHEQKIVEHVLGWAKNRGFAVGQDKAGNVLVKVPASKDHEDAPMVVLQAHLDMVCEKNSDVDHDFMTDPIRVRVDGDWVKSEGTTLGSDNGLGVAAAMAVADDDCVVHGPLELLFTLDEETGLTGAAQLDGSMIEGRIMLNLDSEEDGVIYIGCAGGSDSRAVFSADRTDPTPETSAFRVSVTGLRGGHSGGEIHENRANAIKILARVLRRARLEGVAYSLVSMDGGSKTNAIPREAFAVVRLASDQRSRLESLVSEIHEECRAEFETIDPGAQLGIEDLDTASVPTNPLTDEVAQRIVDVITAIPQGVLSMSREVDGLVETSNNVAVIETGEESIALVTSHRSSVMPALNAVQDMVRSSCELGGATVTIHDAYPGWKPNPESPIVRRTAAVYRELFGAQAEIKAIHAGLECGLLLEKVPGMDVVSFGPEIKNAHSPDEMACISSTEKFYRHLTALLGSLATPG